MGVNLIRSNASYPDPAEVSRDKYNIKYAEAPKLPNPDPDNYNILNYYEHEYRDKKGTKKFLIVEIEYPDCINYEGKKILVYEGINLSELKKQKLIDPHFSDNKKYKSPIARFVPTERGYEMAKTFIKTLI